MLLNTIDGVIAADKKGKIIIFNDAAAAIYGYEKDEALTSVDIRDLYPDEGAKEVMRKLRSDEYGGQGKLKAYEVEILGRNGERIPIRLNAAIVYENGKEEATIGFFHDLREEMAIKQDLERTQIQLLQAEKMASLGKLSAGVAHQINNPLGGIVLFTKLVLEEFEIPEEAHKDLLRVLNDAERCRSIVKELLEFSRQTNREIRHHNINSALERTLLLLENQALFQNIEILKELSDSLPQIPGDIQQLNHVLMNTILNAAEAMEGRGILQIKTYKNPDAGHINIEISDNGPGIPEEVLPHIFDPFFTTKEAGRGTGLGLSLAYGIIEDHKGVIKAQSELGKGSRITIELPLTMGKSEIRED